MALSYKTPSQIADQYLLMVNGLKPEVDISQTDSDWWVRSRVNGGVLSGVYADQILIDNDAFPQSARHDALANFLTMYFSGGFIAAQPSVGLFLCSGATGTGIPFGQQFQYAPNGNLYTATAAVAFSMDRAATAAVPVQSVAAGQAQNLLDGAVVKVVSPGAGVNNTARAFGNISDGRDSETDPEASARILAQIRLPIAGGKVADYEKFALAADPAVTSASVIRYPFGFGTVGVVITSGTTDIDSALNNGVPVILTPSDALVAKVQSYIATQNPTTDCATVFSPASTPINVTVRIRFASGNANTLLADPANTITPGQVSLTQAQFVQREIQRAIYKTPTGGRRFGNAGYVVKSEMEQLIDDNLSAEPYNAGSILQIVADREIDDLAATGPNLMISGRQLPLPGTITVIEVS